MKRQTRGITMIELIVVSLLLGILAAIGSPRFIDLTGRARAAALNGLRAAVNSAATLANALTVAQGNSANQSIVIEGNQTIQIGRASCRERAEISVVAVSLKKKNYSTGACG